MSRAALPPVRVQAHPAPPERWEALLARCPEPDFTASATFCELIGHQLEGASSLYLVAELEGEQVGYLPVVVRTRRGLTRLESSADGALAGPQLVGDIGPRVAAAAYEALARDLADRVGGRTVVAAMNVGTVAGGPPLPGIEDPRWLCEDYEAAVVDCRGGIEQVERELWTNNRRNERNRGLKRGCTLEAARDRETLARWYPLYLEAAKRFAPAAVPLACFEALLALPEQRSVLNVVRLEEDIIAGHFCFRSRDRLVAWQSAVRLDLQRSHFPTTLAYWLDVSLTCELGLAAIDFGGCAGRDTLWDFKRRCGGRPEPRRQWSRRSGLGRLAQRAAGLLRGDSR